MDLAGCGTATAQERAIGRRERAAGIARYEPMELCDAAAPPAASIAIIPRLCLRGSHDRIQNVFTQRGSHRRINGHFGLRSSRRVAGSGRGSNVFIYLVAIVVGRDNMAR